MNKLENLRKELHKHPELSGVEHQTVKRIIEFLRKHNNTKIISLGSQSIAAIYDYKNPGPTVMIRCELDALPIEDDIDTSYRSTRPKVGHKCGHDGHMAIVAGLALKLLDSPPYRGKVILLFQSAEEMGTGAKAVVEDPKLQELNPDYIFALHNIPGQPLGQVILTQDFFSATVHSLVNRLQGVESHASEPKNGRNPALAISEIIQLLNVNNHSKPLDKKYALLTPVHLKMGTPSYGISPALGELHYTLRTWDEKRMTALKDAIQGEVIEVARAHGLAASFEWIEYFPAAQNHTECNQRIQKAATRLNLPIQWKSHPFKFGEDFGWYSKEYKTAMLGMGSGKETPPLHSTSYDFPDELIAPGTSIFFNIIQDILS